VKASIIVASIVAVILVLPPLAFGAFTGAEASIAAVYAFCAAALVMNFSPQLSKFVTD